MNYSKPNKFLFLLIVVFICLSVISVASQEISGTISALGGSVSIQRNESIISVVVGDSVYDADTIITEVDSYVEVTLTADKGFVRIEEETRVEISNFSTDEEAGFSLALFFGTIINSFSKEEDESYMVTTSSLSLGVRGTEFEVTQSLFGESLVVVTKGEVAVGEINSEGEIDEEYTDRINEIILTKGEAAEKTYNTKISRREKIERAIWRSGRKQHRKKAEKHLLIAMQHKAIILGKQMKKVDKACKRLDTIRIKVSKIFVEIEDNIMNNPNIPERKKAKIKQKLLSKNEKAIKKFRKGSRTILKASRMILDEYKSTREMLTELLKRVEDGRIVFHDPKLRSQLKDNLKTIRAIDKDARRLEKSWRKLTKSVRKERRMLRKLEK